MIRFDKRRKIIIGSIIGGLIIITSLGLVIGLKVGNSASADKDFNPATSPMTVMNSQSYANTSTSTSSPISTNDTATVFGDDNPTSTGNTNTQSGDANNQSMVDTEESLKAKDSSLDKNLNIEEEVLNNVGGHDNIKNKAIMFCNAFFNCNSQNLNDGTWRQSVEQLLDGNLNTTGKYRNNRLDESVYTTDWDVNCGSYDLFERRLVSADVTDTYCSVIWSDTKDDALPVACVTVCYNGTYEPGTMSTWDYPRFFKNDYKIVFDKNLKVKALIRSKVRQIRTYGQDGQFHDIGEDYIAPGEQ